MAVDDNNLDPVGQADEVNTDAARKAADDMILEKGGMDVTEDRYSDIVDTSYVGDDELDDFSSTRELRFEIFTEEFDKKFREMFSESLDNEDRKMGAKKMRDIRVTQEEEEDEPMPEPPEWAPPSLIEQMEKDAQKKKKLKKKKKNRKKRVAIWVVLLILFLGIFAFAAYEFGTIYLQQLRERQNLERLAEKVNLIETPEIEEPVVEESVVTEPQVLAKYKELSDSNSDMIGWLSIPGMVIDYPVMYTPDDPEYYLRRDFDGEDATAGMLFVDANCDPVDGDNQIIYGHNMHNGTMFGTLSDYADKEFWENHQFVHYDTLYEEHLYQVVCVFRSYIHFVDEEGFRYYHFYGSSNEQEFNDYVTNIKALQLYDTGVEVSYGDKLIALSTCDYYTDDGRFVVVAKLIR